jgi:hypothetical protein
MLAVTSLVPGGQGSHGGPGTSERPPSTLTGQPARAFLLATAARISRAGTTGRYWCTDEMQGSRELVGPGAKLLPPPWLNGDSPSSRSASAGYQYSIMSRYLNKTCVGHDGTRQEPGVSEQLGTTPVSPADTAAWRHDGSPTR